jgi:hypothetical protein
MMDITKSREEFEAWVVTWWPQSKTMIAEKFDDGGYWNMPLQQYFEVWKAARESLVVELPEMLPDEGYSDAAMHNFCRNDSVKKCAVALRTAGIRINGESE